MSDIGVILLLFVFPLVIDEAYYNITFTKFAFFFIVSLLFVFICFLANLKKKKKTPQVSDEKGIEMTQISMIVFVLSGVLSFIFSKYPYNSIVGYSGRYMGFDFILALFLAYIFISNNYRLKERELVMFLISSVIVFAISFIQICGINFAGFYDGVDLLNRNRFLSTLGNVNVISSFLSMTVPVSVGLYCLRKHKKYENAFLIFSMICGFLFALFSNSDSVFIGIGAGLWFVCFSCFSDKEYLNRLFDTITVMFSSIILYRLINLLPFVNRKSSVLVSIVSGRYVYIAVAVIIIIDIILRKCNVKNLKKVRKYFVGFSAFSVVVAISLFVYFSFINKSADLGSLENHLRFSDEWGTDRGAIWSMCMKAFKQFSLKHKIFGYGEDSILIALSEYTKEKMVSMGYKTDNAHNELIQYLLTIGILGLCAYLCLVFFSLKKLVFSSYNRWLCLSVAAAIIGYVAQSTVNIAQPITTPLLFVLLAFANCVKEQNTLIESTENMN